MARVLKIIRLGMGLVAGLVISLAAVLYFVDFNEYRGLLAAHLSDSLGRPLRIDGDLKLRLGLRIEFSATDLSLGDGGGGGGGAGAKGEHMARIGRLSFGLALRPLLGRRIEIDQLQIEDAEILIRRGPDGRLNWALPQNGGDSQWQPPRFESLRLIRTTFVYRDGATDTVLAADKLSVQRAASGAASVNLVGGLQDLPIVMAARIDAIDALFAGHEIRIDGTFTVAGATAAAKGRVFQPWAAKGIDIHITGGTDQVRPLLRAVGIKSNLEGGADVAFDISDRDGPVALHDLTAQLAPAPGVRIDLRGRIEDALALSGSALDIHVLATQVSALSPLLNLELPPLGQMEMTGRLSGSLLAPSLEAIDGRISLADGSVIDFQGAVRDIFQGQGVNMHVTGRTEQARDVLHSIGLETVLQGSAEVAFDVAGHVGKLGLRNIKMELQPARGVEVFLGGRLDDAVAMTGLFLDFRLQADDSASLTPLAGAEIPSFSPLRVQGRIVGSAARPAVIDLDLRAGTPDRVLLTARGTIAEPLKAGGLDLRLRLQGPDSAVLSIYVNTALPVLGRFDLTARLKGQVRAPRLDRIAGRFRHSDGLKVDLDGSVANLSHGEGIDLGFSAEIPGRSALWSLLALERRIAGGLTASGRIVGSSAALHLDNLALTYGDSDLTGDVNIDVRARPLLFNAELHSKHLDLSFLTAEPGSPKTAKVRPSPRVIPNQSFKPGALAAWNGELKFRASRLRWDRLIMSGVNLTVGLKDGAVSVRPSTAEVAGGQLVVEGRWGPDGASLKMDLRRAAMAALGPVLDITDVDGDLDLALDLRGSGRDLRTLAAGLRGSASVVVSHGFIDNQFLEPLARDLIAALLDRPSSKEGARLHCFANSYDIKDGIAVSQVLLLDTENITVVGEGRIDLSTEALRFYLTPRPKDASLLSLATPINVGGTLANPEFTPDSVALAGSVAKAVVGNLLLPGVGLLLPLLDAGTGEAHPCLNVVKDGQARAADKAPEGSALGQLGDRIVKGAGSLLKLPGKLLESE